MSDMLLLQKNYGFYPEKKRSRSSPLDDFLKDYPAQLLECATKRDNKCIKIVDRTRSIQKEIESCSDIQLRERIQDFRLDLSHDISTIDHVARIFAFVREVSGRLLGMKHHDVQIAGGWVLLNGMIAEMETGEGKTLTATLPAIVSAMYGIPVHIITVNDYLAQRDAELMRPIYEAMGVGIGAITHGLTSEERRAIYAKEVVYCSNKEIVFDYLKDRLLIPKRPGQIEYTLQQLTNKEAVYSNLLLRGLHYAIVDEADSVLVDEARTPLIISGAGENVSEENLYTQAFEFAKQLIKDVDFTMKASDKKIALTDAGYALLAKHTENVGGCWKAKHRTENLVTMALSALHLFERDRDYIVKEKKVQIIDEYTGRTMADRSWERGLHQLIEYKEGCTITQEKEVLARISYQRFFRRYTKLAGMTGTATEVASELRKVYDLKVKTLATNKKLIRKQLPGRIFLNVEKKTDAIIQRVKELNAIGRPILIGTTTVAFSEEISTRLQKEGLSHRVLNARQDKEEAEIISRAGEKYQITVATNMAGRGTDIILGCGVKQIGGLHVLAAERQSARRIDRQLFGRCGRQGDPGTYEMYESVDDPLIKQHCRKGVNRILQMVLRSDRLFFEAIFRLYFNFVQRSQERKHYLLRRRLLDIDESMEKNLAFSGEGE